MPLPNVREQLTNRLAAELGASEAVRFVGRLETSAVQPAELVVLLDELEAVSGKVARAAIEALPEFDRRAGCSLMIPWLDVGVALAQSSGATALRYFKDSPLILGLMEEVEQRRAVLAVALELAEDDPNVTWEFLKAAPQTVMTVPGQHWARWLEIGVEVTQSDAVIGLEYIRQIPALALVLPCEDIRHWLSFGMKLISSNAFGKPDYFPAIEYLRRSPAILGDIEAPLRAHVISIGTLLASRDSAAAIAWLAESPMLLRSLSSSPWRLKLLQYGALVAELNSDAALSYLRRAPELIGLLGEEQSGFPRFENWFKTGMEVLAYSPEGARAYFSAESRQALSSLETALSGVPLRQVARRVKLFVEALCGSEVVIAARSGEGGQPAKRAAVTAHGRTITLPAWLRRYSTAEENERLYLIMAAHEAGHLEFGTYRLRIDALTDVSSAVAGRYGRSGSPALQTLGDLFRLYPQPRLMHDLWTVLEDARIEFLLQQHYPGLRRDLAQFAAETVTARDPGHALTVRELVVDCLLRLSTGASLAAAVPRAIVAEVSILWQLCGQLFRTTSTAEDAVRVADEVYRRLEQLIAAAPKTPADSSIPEASEIEGRGTSSDSDMYRGIDNLMYRGDMNADLVAGETEEEPAMETAFGAAEGRDARPKHGGEQQSTPAGEALAGGRSLPDVVEEFLAVDVEARFREVDAGGEHICRYPEWDFRLQDHRLNWCRVVERTADPGSDETVSLTLNAHRSTVRLLRRSFEALRPPAFRRVGGQPDGDELDLDALVRRAAEQRAGSDGGDRIYVRHEKRRRDVAVLFLVDVSGSTGRQIDSGRRVIDVEKESLVLLCEALDAVGDQYALYAYSGQGRGGVEVRAIKQFDEPLGIRTAERLGGLAPQQQNRDGAAIRHAAAKLRQRDVKTRLLILLSDGRPLDGEYTEDYALEDTKAALREARREGIHPFCVTIDSEADQYVRRMYGDVEYTVIDRVESLPARLPKIYQRLAT
jgi:nitric oxide reductase NorD protein